MTQAQSILAQIKDHYSGVVPNLVSLCHRLRDNKIDTGVATNTKHAGFNSPCCYDDGYPQIMYYDDGSLLIIVQGDIFAAMTDSDQ